MGNDEQAAHTFFGSDGEVGKDDEIRDPLKFDGGDDGDVGRVGAKGFGTLRGHCEGEIVLALQRTVGEAADQWRGVEILHDGDAEFVHSKKPGRKEIIAEANRVRSGSFVV